MSNQTLPVLNYSQAPRAPRRTVAALLCVPALCLWGLLLAQWISPSVPFDVIPIWTFLLLLAMVVAAAFSSFLTYAGREKPWYVRVCLLLTIGSAVYALSILPGFFVPIM